MLKQPRLNQWVNRTTKQFLEQISSGGMESRFPAEIFHDVSGPISNAKWIHAADLSAVAGVPNKYWIITGDIVSEMSAGEKTAVDAAVLTTRRDAQVTEVDQTEGNLRQILKILIGELNTLRALHGLPDRTLAQLRNAIRNGYGT